MRLSWSSDIMNTKFGLRVEDCACSLAETWLISVSSSDEIAASSRDDEGNIDSKLDEVQTWVDTALLNVPMTPQSNK